MDKIVRYHAVLHHMDTLRFTGWKLRVFKTDVGTEFSVQLESPDAEFNSSVAFEAARVAVARGFVLGVLDREGNSPCWYADVSPLVCIPEGLSYVKVDNGCDLNNCTGQCYRGAEVAGCPQVRKVEPVKVSHRCRKCGFDDSAYQQSFIDLLNREGLEGVVNWLGTFVSLRVEVDIPDRDETFERRILVYMGAENDDSLMVAAARDYTPGCGIPEWRVHDLTGREQAMLENEIHRW